MNEARSFCSQNKFTCFGGYDGCSLKSTFVVVVVLVGVQSSNPPTYI